MKPPVYNLDYDLFVLDPENKDTTDYQRADCIYDALQKIDYFIKTQRAENRALKKELKELKVAQELTRKDDDESDKAEKVD